MTVEEVHWAHAEISALGGCPQPPAPQVKVEALRNA